MSSNFNITNSNSDIEMYIYKPKLDTMYQVVVEEPVVWTTEQNGSAGKLEFTIVKKTHASVEDEVSFPEGAIAIFRYKGVEVFRGRVFIKQRDKEQHISCTAYDSLRYFKNEVSPRVLGLHQGTTTTKILNWLCSTQTNSFTKGDGKDAFRETNVNITWNEVEPKTLFDIMEEVEAQTREKDPKHTIYTLYDDCGKLYYKSLDDMKLDLVIDETALENFSYTTSLDDETYNRVMVYWDDDEGSTTKTKKTTSEERAVAGAYIYPEKDENNPNIEAWGVLQLTQKIDSSVPNPQDHAKKLLEIHNKKSRDLTLQGVLGDVRARAGASPILYMHLGDMGAQQYAFITKARHTFENKFHTMDLDVSIKVNEKGAV